MERLALRWSNRAAETRVLWSDERMVNKL
uniref:Uncharacterized protein n=1 Tax=Physcomitrium patens TaxID=3218 RepID=A0A2K1KIN9_PHYPA|nr:hypothetical protein PHYPA_007329 [Physcomitrium patens]